MPVDKENFQIAATEAAEKELRAGEWRVYKVYEEVPTPPADVPGMRTAPDFYIRAVGGFLGEYEEYEPLVSQRTLFLKFARLADEGEITQEAWKRWVDGYGVLGLDRHSLVRDVVEGCREQGADLDTVIAELDWHDVWGHKDRKLNAARTDGGPRETYRGFVREAEEAHRLLKLYEAATHPDGPNVRAIKRYADQEDRTAGIETPRAAKGWALGWVAYQVQEVIGEECYPMLYRVGDKFPQGWGFHTLLGAMYLQLAWLLASTDQVRCGWCGDIVSHSQPNQNPEPPRKRGVRKEYKMRNDRAFCVQKDGVDDKCYDAWYYQNVTKPKREARRLS